MSYVSLHNHTDFSNIKFPDSINTVESLIDYTHQLGLFGVAITDHDCVSSYIKIAKHIEKRKKENESDKSWQDFKVIYGNEIYLCRNGMNKDNYIKGEDRFFHFILLAKDKKGNQQIRELSTKAWKRSYTHFHRRVPTYYSDLEEIIKPAQGHVIASSACLGSWIDTRIVQASKYERGSENWQAYYDAIDIWLNKMIEIFGKGHFFLELQPGLSKEQKIVNKELLRLGKEYDIDCIITTDSHYLKAEDRPIHKAYLNSKEGEREVDDFYEAAHVMSPKEICERMEDYIDRETIGQLFKNTIKIANMCEKYDIREELHLPYLPEARPETEEKLIKEINNESAEVLPNLLLFLNSKESSDRQLAIRLYNFLIKNEHGSFIDNAKAMDYELGIIWDSSDKQGVRWSKYLLQMADYIDIIWNEGDSLVCPSRGSAGASYVMYALKIIQIDKTREKAPLLFERFINPERQSVLD